MFADCVHGKRDDRRISHKFIVDHHKFERLEQELSSCTLSSYARALIVENQLFLGREIQRFHCTFPSPGRAETEITLNELGALCPLETL